MSEPQASAGLEASPRKLHNTGAQQVETHQDADAAALKTKRLPPIVRTHDIFNLVTLGVLNVLNVAYLAGGCPGQVLLLASFSYFLADASFVGIFPRCVRSPEVILVHHVLATALILIPLRYERFIWCLSYCMLIEINTWLLISKRTVHVAAQLQEALFLISWVTLRNVWYPVLIWVFYQEWRSESLAVGTPWNPILVTPVFQLFLTGLNFHWTIALFSKKREERPKQL